MAKTEPEFQTGSDLEEKPTPKKRTTSSRKSRGESISVEESTQRVYQLYTVVGKLLGSSKKRKESDFNEEGAQLSRLSEKYALVAFILKWLDPIFFMLGVINKFGDHFEEKIERAKRKKAEREAARAGAILTTLPGEGEAVNDFGTDAPPIHYTS